MGRMRAQPLLMAPPHFPSYFRLRLLTDGDRSVKPAHGYLHHNGSLFKSLHDPDLIQGHPVSNAERHSTAASAYSEFKGRNTMARAGGRIGAARGCSAPRIVAPNSISRWCHADQSHTSSHLSRPGFGGDRFGWFPLFIQLGGCGSLAL